MSLFCGAESLSQPAAASSSTTEILFQCTKCDKPFNDESSLRLHLQTHSDQQQLFSCAECGQTFRWQSVLDIHLTTHSHQRQFSCVECGKTFKHQKAFTAHLKTHSHQRPFPCTTCGKAFKRRYALTVHLNTHSHQRPFPCAECDKTFKCQTALTTHLKTHSHQRPFPCAECGKTFKRRYALTVHLKTHSREGPFSCVKCGKTFKSEEWLKKHLKRHALVKRFECSICNKNFIRSSNLRRHERMVHESSASEKRDEGERAEQRSNECLQVCKKNENLVIELNRYSTVGSVDNCKPNAEISNLSTINQAMVLHESKEEKTVTHEQSTALHVSSNKCKEQRETSMNRQSGDVVSLLVMCSRCKQTFRSKTAFSKHLVQCFQTATAKSESKRLRRTGVSEDRKRFREDFVWESKKKPKRCKPVTCFVCQQPFAKESLLLKHIQDVHYKSLVSANDRLSNGKEIDKAETAEKSRMKEKFPNGARTLASQQERAKNILLAKAFPKLSFPQWKDGVSPIVNQGMRKVVEKLEKCANGLPTGYKGEHRLVVGAIASACLPQTSFPLTPRGGETKSQPTLSLSGRRGKTPLWTVAALKPKFMKNAPRKRGSNNGERLTKTLTKQDQPRELHQQLHDCGFCHRTFDNLLIMASHIAAVHRVNLFVHLCTPNCSHRRKARR